jgi:hypothetical protein
MRNLAHIEKIISLQSIDDADSIEKAIILGWEVVIKKGEFNTGDLVVYCEIDSVLPEKEEFEFLRNRKFRIRTIKLKGQVSQGICFPLSILPKGKYSEGQDVTNIIGIEKYLSPTEKEEISQEELRIKNEKNKLKKFLTRYSWFRKLFLSRKKKNGFPYWVSKTDEERIQNVPHILEQFKDYEVYVTEKIDYQSGTWTGQEIPKFGGLLGQLIPLKKFLFVVCSRNLTNNDKNSLYWKIAKKYNIEQILRENPTLTIQGEQGDTKVQGNKYSITKPTMWVFNIINHKTNYHYDYNEMKEFCDLNNLKCVPLVGYHPIKIKDIGSTVQEFVEYSKGKSLINSNIHREGIVVRCIKDGKKLLSFKVINPDFLLKYSD